jgi:GAF domain-containing protein
MAVPLLDEERVLGVLQVLDRPSDARFSLREMELLGLFAGQAAIALSLLMTARSARAALAGDAEASLVAGLAGALDRLEGDSRDSAGALLRSLTELLGDRH